MKIKLSVTKIKHSDEKVTVIKSSEITPNKAIQTNESDFVDVSNFEEKTSTIQRDEER